MFAGTRRIAAAAAEAGVGHLVGLSIVGCDRTPLGYYGVKAEQESVIEASGVPWSVLRATQFHDLPSWVFARAARRHLVPAGRWLAHR